MRQRRYKGRDDGLGIVGVVVLLLSVFPPFAIVYLIIRRFLFEALDIDSWDIFYILMLIGALVLPPVAVLLYISTDGIAGAKEEIPFLFWFTAFEMIFGFYFVAKSIQRDRLRAKKKKSAEQAPEATDTYEEAVSADEVKSYGNAVHFGGYEFAPDDDFDFDPDDDFEDDLDDDFDDDYYDDDDFY